MPVPACASFWCHVGFNKVRDDFAVGGCCNAKIAVKEKIMQSTGDKFRVARFHMGKLG